MRVVLDANVVVSGVIKEEGPPGQILSRLFQARQFISVTSLEILAEIREVLQRPKVRRYHGWTDEEIDAFVTFLYAESVVTEGKLTVNVARDPQDNKFLVGERFFCFSVKARRATALSRQRRLKQAVSEAILEVRRVS